MYHHMEILFDRTSRDSRLSTVIRRIEILFDRTSRDSRHHTVIRHMEILFDRTSRDSRLSTVIWHIEIRLWPTGDSRLNIVIWHVEILFDNLCRLHFFHLTRGCYTVPGVEVRMMWLVVVVLLFAYKIVMITAHTNRNTPHNHKHSGCYGAHFLFLSFFIYLF